MKNVEEGEGIQHSQQFVRRISPETIFKKWTAVISLEMKTVQI